MPPATAIAAPTILVIDDNEDTRDVLAVLLRSKGYNVIEAEDGLEGLLKAGGQYPDLVITDLALPEMDGVETARRILGMPKLANTPILVVSAYLTVELEAEVLAAGCVTSFSKPFDPDSLLEKIKIALITRKAIEANKRAVAQAQAQGYIRVTPS